MQPARPLSSNSRPTRSWLMTANGLAADIDAWYLQLPEDLRTSVIGRMPETFSDLFDGRLFRCVEALVDRRYITRDDLRRVGTGNYSVANAEHCARYMHQWANRLRRK